VSWKQKSSATLTIAQDLSGTLTDVFKVNGTEYEVINFWNGKASVELSNGTEIRWANITLTNVALEDEGVYTVKIREGATDEETLYNTGHLRIDTYGLLYLGIFVNCHQFGWIMRFAKRLRRLQIYISVVSAYN
jgi:hypothetical protein